jgi:hypothetical protein
MILYFITDEIYQDTVRVIMVCADQCSQT